MKNDAIYINKQSIPIESLIKPKWRVVKVPSQRQWNECIILEIAE